jgi:ribosome-associated toxin RatA of RatAB toxin-antitoxin module
MTIVDEHFVAAPPEVCFRIAADVERWPQILPHYRWVRFRDKQQFGTGTVEMSAWRRFSAGIKYPTWWVSEMRSTADEPAVYYKHIDGITRGMDVKWELNAEARGTLIRLYHTWDGPSWPIIKGVAAEWVILPHFVSAIARRTLAGVARAAELRARSAS